MKPKIPQLFGVGSLDISRIHQVEFDTGSEVEMVVYLNFRWVM